VIATLAAVLTRVRSTFVLLRFTASAFVSVGANAFVLIDAIDARAVIDARGAITFIDVGGTDEVVVAFGAVAAESIDFIDAPSSIQTRIGGAFINVHLANRPCSEENQFALSGKTKKASQSIRSKASSKGIQNSNFINCHPPEYPGLHLQVNSSMPSSHVAPFKQGFDTQSFGFNSQFDPKKKLIL
jgi:hypothetical protein